MRWSNAVAHRSVSVSRVLTRTHGVSAPPVYNWDITYHHPPTLLAWLRVHGASHRRTYIMPFVVSLLHYHHHQYHRTTSRVHPLAGPDAVPSEGRPGRKRGVFRRAGKRLRYCACLWPSCAPNELSKRFIRYHAIVPLVFDD